MKILVAGDFCANGRVSGKIAEGDYASLFDKVKPVIEQADYSIVNFEFPIVLSEGKPIKKCGPHLRGQITSIDAIKYAGFNVCTLANNHILDQGEQCCLDTKRLIEESGMQTVGVGKNLEESSKILYLQKEKEILAVINCCEHEFSIATETTAGANPINPIRQYYKIQEAKQNADYVLIIVHGGNEYYQLPSPRLQDTYRFFIDAGADAVVNHHQHCYNGYELYRGKPILYGLGNFLFDYLKNRTKMWNEGLLVEISFDKTIGFKVVPYEQCGTEVGISLSVNSDIFLQKMTKLNNIISDRKHLQDEFEKFMRLTQNRYKTVISFYSNAFLTKLYIKGFLPDLFSSNKWRRLHAMISCESHYERFSYYVKSKIN